MSSTAAVPVAAVNTSLSSLPSAPKEIHGDWLQEQRTQFRHMTATTTATTTATAATTPPPTPPQLFVHVDVRRTEELQQDGRIPWAAHIPLAALEAHHLPEDKENSVVGAV